MNVFTKRNALIGWIVARIARKRLERRLNAIARGGDARRRRKLVLGAGAGLLAGAAFTAGALVARRTAEGDAQPA